MVICTLTTKKRKKFHSNPNWSKTWSQLKPLWTIQIWFFSSWFNKLIQFVQLNCIHIYMKKECSEWSVIEYINFFYRMIKLRSFPGWINILFGQFEQFSCDLITVCTELSASVQKLRCKPILVEFDSETIKHIVTKWPVWTNCLQKKNAS